MEKETPPPAPPETGEKTQVHVEVQLPKEKGLRRFRRAIALVLLGGCSVEAWHLFRPAEQPTKLSATFEQAPKPEEKYRHTLDLWIRECQKRWPHMFSLTGVDKDGHASIRPGNAEGMRSSASGTSALVLHSDGGGKLTYLKEQLTGSSVPSIEMWPEKGDARLYKSWRASDGTVLDEYIWISPKDTLRARIANDDSIREFTIDGEGVVDPHADPEVLAKQLSTPQRMALFQKVHAKHEIPTVGEFFRKYRPAAQDLQSDDFRGNCNAFAEMSCEILSRHGYPMLVVSMSPPGLHKVADIGWHQVAAYRLGDGYVVIDDGEMHYVPSLEAYTAKRNMTILPIGGVVPWERADNPVAKFGQHIGIRYEK